MPTRLALLLSITLLAACSKNPVFTTVANGQLQGYVDDQVEHFLGIPYAQPPLGNLRWREPQPAGHWQGALSVQQNPTRCQQYVPVLEMQSGSEDCLYLNVWAPVRKPARPMPVMVWIHGGGFIVGQGSYTDGDGMQLARDQGVVVVSVNYRLGIFGFMAHEALTGENPAHPTSGNYGLEDQMAALRWVRDNISAFGGDPANITIFGQSAGGVSVCALLASPAAAGLFDRAIIQSAPCATPLSSMQAVSAVGAEVAAQLSCDAPPDTLACLRAKPADELAAAAPPDPSFGFGEDYTMWWPVLDGEIIPLQFVEAFETGQFNKVPVISGATRDEASLLIWFSHNMLFKPLQADQYADRLRYLTGSAELADKVIEKYPLQQYASPFEALTASYSDSFFNCLTRWQTRALSRHVPVWSYQFDYDRAPFVLPAQDLGAFHSAEIQYIFGRRMSILGADFDPSERGLRNSMMTYWAEFARSGNPDGTGITTWPPYDHSDETLLFNLDNSIASAVHREACRFWEDLPYLRPAYR